MGNPQGFSGFREVGSQHKFMPIENKGVYQKGSRRLSVSASTLRSKANWGDRGSMDTAPAQLPHRLLLMQHIAQRQHELVGPLIEHHGIARSIVDPMAVLA